jgi:beta-lactamase regulating signal transducer with metallopeptidase domain
MPWVEWLLTWIWQGIAVTLLAAGFVRIGNHRNAATRYLVWWIALTGVGLLAVLPWGRTLSADAITALVTVVPSGTVAPPHPVADLLPVQVPATPFWVLVTGSLMWAGFSCRRLVKLLRSGRRLLIVRQHCTPIPADLERRLTLWMAVREEGRTARLCLSDDVATASMLGLGTPIIALPRSLVHRLDHADLDQVVLHEHGHVQRRDDFAQFAQVVIEALCGWHPAVRWIGRQLRLEREVACDDWVLNRTSSRYRYATCLKRVASLALGRQTLVVSPRVLRSRSELLRRVDRLLDVTRSTELRPARTVLLASVVVLCTSVVLLGSTPPIVTSRTNAATLMGRSPIFDVDASIPIANVSRLIRTQMNAGLRQTHTDVQRQEPSSPSVVPRAQPVPLESLDLGPMPRVGTVVLSPPVTERPAARPALTSSILVLDVDVDTVEAPPNTTISRQVARLDRDADNQNVNTNRVPRPWREVALAGRAIGIGASQAGIAAASAFQAIGTSFSRAFAGRR